MQSLPEIVLRETQQNAALIGEYLGNSNVAIASIIDRQPNNAYAVLANEAIADINHCIVISERLDSWSKGYLDIDDVPVSQAEIEQAYDLSSDMDDAFNRAVKSIRTIYQTCDELKSYASQSDHLPVAKYNITKIVNTYQRYSHA